MHGHMNVKFDFFDYLPYKYIGLIV
jgi:hypothetical protein